MEPLNVEITDSLKRVDEAEWNRLVPPDDPFTDYRFLLALEESGSVGPEAGWSSCHVLVRHGERVVAALPLYAKDHSYGEYIFDWMWANASHRSGIPYYPKLVSAVPFTPATGARLLVEEGRTVDSVMHAIRAGWKRVATDLEAMSFHVLFCTESEAELWCDAGEFIRRKTFQFHWRNEGWGNFEEFLGALRSPSRKQIRRERRLARDSGLELRISRGDELGEDTWSQLYSLYRSTTDKKGAYPYLQPSFFEVIRERFSSSLVVAGAYDNGGIQAASISFQKGRHLYGRYWGMARPDLDFLHFELCYYALIEYALERGYTLFEAGAQGAHKLKRGLLPCPTWSVHWLRHKGLREAIASHVLHEGEEVDSEMDYFSARTPFTRG